MDAVYFILGNLTCLGLKTFWINLTWTDSDYHNAKSTLWRQTLKHKL